LTSSSASSRAQITTTSANVPNGRPAVLLRERGDRAQLRAHRLLVLDVDAASGRIGALHAHREPAVLTAFGG